MTKCSKRLRSYFYSEETYELLNYLTLTIKDKEIQEEYSRYRTNRFNKFFWPQVFMYSGFMLFGWLSYSSGSSEVASAQRPLHLLLVLLVQAVPRYCFNKYSTFSVVPMTAIPLIMVQLAYRGYLPGHDTNLQKCEYETIAFAALIITFVVNCMTFLQTVAIFPALHIGFFYA